MKKTLIISDLQLTNKPRDAYRWDLFPWLVNAIEKHNVKNLYILGDITESKNNHSSELVNMFMDVIYTFSSICDNVVILKGNHDFVDEEQPFFNFLNGLDNVKFVSDIWVKDRDELFIPYTKNFEEVFETIPEKEFNNYQRIYIHQDIFEAKLANNTLLQTGISARDFDNCSGRIFSGHIHVPHEIGKVVYVGAPYPVDCGDNYQGRVILLDDNMEDYRSIPYETIKKPSLIISDFDELKDCDLNKGDQVKIVVELEKSRLYEWKDLRNRITNYCNEKQVIINTIKMCVEESESVSSCKSINDENQIQDDYKYFDNFVSNENLGRKYKRIGAEIIE